MYKSIIACLLLLSACCAALPLVEVTKTVEPVVLIEPVVPIKPVQNKQDVPTFPIKAISFLAGNLPDSKGEMKFIMGEVIMWQKVSSTKK